MLNKKSEFIETKIAAELANAKKFGTKNKRQALNALKKKKRLEKQQEQIDNTLTTIEFQREALEGAQSNANILENMNVAAKAMKNAANGMSVDKVDDMMDEIQEASDVANEISDAISRPMGFQSELDDDDLLAELEELEQEELDSEMLNIPSSSQEPSLNLPAAPTKAPAAPAAQAVDDELADLEQWMAN
ncbi:unnamed protein product [Oikopleura dioica]|uniref:Charged multivesicular body protein 4b n=1 Tax=Oikopleura dioica TaxID=34765 RepID=E4WVL9_OIKDI|nr:unnamed protein product [Oikopleura dioica]CBY21172.1 unnamed protein product [Oikopleura dioica]